MKKICCLFIGFFLLLPISIKAVTTYDRETLTHYGVNKKWSITSINQENVLATPKVDASEKIYDFSNILTEEEEILLKAKIEAFIEKYNTDLVLLIDDLYYTVDSKNETYASDFYDYNDFGIEFDRYSGILLFRNTYSEDPYYDIYTFGNAQLYFTQSRYDAILDGIYSSMVAKDYYHAFSSFIDRIHDSYEKGIPNQMKKYVVDENGYLTRIYKVPWIVCISIAFLITSMIMSIYIKKNKMIIKATQATDYLDQNNLTCNIKKATLVNSYTTSYSTSSYSGGGSSGGGFSSSGSSGGGHSSGGGRHG